MRKLWMNVPMAALLIVGTAATWASGAAASDQPVVLFQGAESYGPVTPHVTPRVSQLPQLRGWRPGDAVREIPRRVYPAPGTSGAALGVGLTDPLPQLNSGERAPSLVVDVNQDGIGYTGAVPPDTVGDVGPNHFVQAVNASRVAVYDKSGTLLHGPFDLDSLAPVGDSCRGGGGDPIVLYDQLADRWFLQEFIGGGNKLCLYISVTSDPAGAYYFYGFGTPNFPDYPHYGVWPDAYYAGTNEGGSGETTYAFDRVNMLAGLPATMQRLAEVSAMPGYGFQVLTPADHDGAVAPPAGAAGIFMRHFDDEAHSGSADPAADALQLFEMSIDWDTPANTTITQLPSVSITDYNSWFRGYSTFFSVPQPGGGSLLDPIREAILNRLVYRNFGTHEALVGNFATNRNPATSGNSVSAGVRWFELRRSGGPGNPWALHQEGTFGGDANSMTANYFMSAIAMDGVGNIGLGYSKTDTSGSTPAFPSIGVSGRLADDLAGAMTAGETTVANGTQASNQGGRWGDYAAMGIDPADDCTFWYTNEYQPGSVWDTRITSFVFEECLLGFGLEVTPLSVDACAITDADPQFTIDLGQTGGWTGAVTLSASGLPPGTSAVFSANGQQPPFSSLLTVEDIALSATGSYAIQIDAVGDDVPPTERSATVTLDLAMIEPEAPLLASPANNAPAMPLQPTLSWSAAADAEEYLVEIATDPGFGTVVYSALEAGTSHVVADPIASSTQHYWRVSASNNCGALSSEVRSFTTVAVLCSVYTATGLPIPIPTQGTITSSLTVEGIDLAGVSDIDVVGVAGTHNFVSDLEFRLQGPESTQVVLLSGACGSQDDFDLGFDDEAAAGAVTCPPTSGGMFQPQEPLSAFDGDDALGTWTLEVQDFDTGNGGSLTGWGLQVCAEAGEDLSPVFTSTPQTSAEREQPYSYAIAVDAPGGAAAVTVQAEGALPDWLTLVDLGNGQATLSGAPGFDDVGANAVSLRAENGPFHALQSFTIQVADVNVPPEFTSTPVLTGTRAVAYTYVVTASDANEGDSVSFAAATLPAWLSLADHGDGSATLSGTPDFADVGDNAVSLTVSDGSLDAAQPFVIDVADVNVGPAFVSTPVTTAEAAAPYQYDVVASDPNLGAALSISSIGPLPAWLSLLDHGDGTATLSGTPGYEDAGQVYLVLQVSDGLASSEQPFGITVTSTNTAPVFASDPPTRVVAGQLYSYSIQVDDPTGPVDISAEGALPPWLVLEDNGDGTAVLSGAPAASDIGAVSVTLVASDGSLETHQSFEIEVLDEPLFADGFESQ